MEKDSQYQKIIDLKIIPKDQALNLLKKFHNGKNTKRNDAESRFLRRIYQRYYYLKNKNETDPEEKTDIESSSIPSQPIPEIDNNHQVDSNSSTSSEITDLITKNQLFLSQLEVSKEAEKKSNETIAILKLEIATLKSNISSLRDDLQQAKDTISQFEENRKVFNVQMDDNASIFREILYK